MAIAFTRSVNTNTVGLGVLFALAVLTGFLAFWDSHVDLVRRWYHQEEFSHGFFIPLITAWLLWSRRQAIRDSIGAPSWGGPVLILFAAALHVVGQLSALIVFSSVGFVLCLLGIVLSFGGFSLLKVTAIPISFLLFAIPPPSFIDSTLSFRLQLISSELGVSVIRLFGIPVYLQGNLIDLGHYKLQVVEACSGLRYLYPFLSLGFLAAYMFHAPLWQRGLVFVSTVPITILMNSFRIGMIGVMVDRWGPQSADGFLHFFEGWIIFIACAGLLAAEIYILARLAGKRFFEVFYPPKVTTVPQSDSKPRHWRMAFPLVAGLLIVCTAGFANKLVAGRQEIFPDRVQFASFPDNLGEWRGRRSQLEPRIEHTLGLTDYILSDYARQDGRWVNFYVAYYASQRHGVAPHTPILCIPGNGWRIATFERTAYHDEGLNQTLPLNRVIIERESQKQIVYYWFVQRGRRIENEWLSKWYLLTDSILKNRTDGALVRLTTLVYPGESERDADRRLRSLFRELEPQLVGYLPSETISDVRSTQKLPKLKSS